jgi:hypothetical protein
MRTDARENMHNKPNWHWLSPLPGLAVGHVNAAPIEGSLGSNAAALLVLLGIGALLMGMRNLRKLRHKRLTPGRSPRGAAPERQDQADDHKEG